MLLFGIHQKFKGHFLNKLRVFFNEAIKNPSAGAWSSLMCMLALSSVFCCNIESVYPDERSLVEKKILNGAIKPRKSEFKTRDTLAILWISFKTAVGTF